MEHHTTKSRFVMVWMFFLTISYAFWWSFVIISVWNWFLVRSFGFPVLRLPVVVPIFLLLSQFFSGFNRLSSENNKELTGVKMIEITLNSWLNMVLMQGGPVLLVAWIAYFFL